MAAEFVQQTQQTSIAPANAILYTTDNPTGVYDTIGLTPTPYVGPSSTGTQFLLPVGTYMIDFENSNDAAWSLSIRTSPVVNGPYNTVDENTIAGSTTATTWIHGRAIIVAAAPTWFIISPVTGTQSIPTAGTAAGEFTARLTVLKIA